MRNHQTTLSSDPEVGSRALLLGTSITLDPLELLLVLSTEDSGDFRPSCHLCSSSFTKKGDSDPFVEFLILLYFVIDCEELCDAKCTV